MDNRIDVLTTLVVLLRANCRPNLETRLSEAGILRIKNDIGVQRIVWCAAGDEGQHDVTV